MQAMDGHYGARCRNRPHIDSARTRVPKRRKARAVVAATVVVRVGVVVTAVGVGVGVVIVVAPNPHAVFGMKTGLFEL